MTTNNSIMRRSHERVYCHFRARVHLTLLITTDDCGAFQVENEALTGTLQRMSVQSNQDQMEIQRLSNDLAQGKARVIELQDGWQASVLEQPAHGLGRELPPTLLRPSIAPHFCLRKVAHGARGRA